MNKKSIGFVEAILYVIAGIGIFLPFVTVETSLAYGESTFFSALAGKLSLLLAIGGVAMSIMKATKPVGDPKKQTTIYLSILIAVLCVYSAITTKNHYNTGIYRSADTSFAIGFFIVVIPMVIETILAALTMKGGNNSVPVANQPYGQPMVTPMGQPVGASMQQPPTQPMVQQVPQQVNNMVQQPPMGTPMNQPMQQSPMVGQTPMNNQQNNNFPNGQM